MKFTATGIGVDAGMIMVADISYAKDVEKYGFCKKELERLGKVFHIPNGKYKINYRIPNMQDGDGEPIGDDICFSTEEINVTSGSIFICDPCYPIGKDKDGKYTKNSWNTWLSDTDFGNNLKTDKAFIIDSMGGDGCYDVEFEMTLIEEKNVKNVKGDRLADIRTTIDRMRIDGRLTEEIVYDIKSVYNVTMVDLVNIINWVERDLDTAY